MLLKKWDDLPPFLKKEEIKNYYDELNNKKISLIIKRIFDFTVSLLFLIILSPVFLLLALLIKTDSSGPVFYKQERITQYGRKFKIVKFRTMVVNADSIGTLITKENDSRITKVGNLIRKVRLDEIPQLFNVLLGDMSFVGTRPEVSKYVKEYSNEMNATLLLPAGVTSLASLKYRDEDRIISDNLKKELSVDEIYINILMPKKMELNLKYLKEFSILKDIVICIKTVI